MQPTAHVATSPRSQPDRRSSDQALLQGLGRGDPGAASAFVHQFQRRVYGLARTIVGDRTQAEEVAQEALIRAWRKAGSYDSRRGSVSTWVFTITRNLAVDSLRRKGAQPADPRALLFLDQPAHGSVPEDAATAADETHRVRTALVDLPVEQRRALLLAAFYGYSAREIARTEAIPLGTAKSRIRLGLKKVRSLLGQDELQVEAGDAHNVGRRLPRPLPIASNQ
jgi:RNA polymerase sigma-70 factor (ECF subfamily)